MPPDDDEEFALWWESLSPEEQEYFTYENERATANQMPFSFGGGGEEMLPGLSPGQFDLAQFNGGAALPELTAKGKVDPYDLSQAAKRYNLMQDYGTGTVDNALAMFAGPGAYGPDAFAPTVTPPQKRANDSGSRMARQYASGGGYEGFLAQKILEGATPSEAYADMMDLVNAEPDENVNPEAAAMRDELIASLPKRAQTGPQAPGTAPASPYDDDRILNFGNDLFQTIFKDDQPVYVDPETGVGYMDAPQEESSKAAKWYEDRGLPMPTDTYDSPEYTAALLNAFGYGESDAKHQETRSKAEAGYNKAAQEAERLKGQVDPLTVAYEDFMKSQSPAGFVTPNPRSAMGRSEGMSAEGLMQRQTAAPQLGRDGMPGGQPLNMDRQTFDFGDPETIKRQQADAALTNLASQFQQGGFRPRYDGQRAPQMPMVDKRNGRISASLGGIQANPDAPFDFSVALGNPKNNETISRGTIDRAKTQAKNAEGRRRKEFAKQRDARYYAPDQSSQDAAYALGQQIGAAKKGRTPLQDAILQRLLSQSAMGGR